MATVNQKILNSLNTYNQQKDIQLAETYVEQVAGKQLSTEDYTSAEKTKLAGIATGANKYVLPAATDKALGGVIVGDNISNTSGKISISQQNVIGALGYTPADRTVGTKTALGLSKLYDQTGSAVDGSITQAKITSELNLKANLASPVFTGTPKTPTAAAGTNTTQLATTEFVQAAKLAYGQCNTNSFTQNKSVTVPNFVLVEGARIIVRFRNYNATELPTLNVNNTGAKPITYRGFAISSNYICAGMLLEMMYINDTWEVVGELTYSFTDSISAQQWKVIGRPFLSPTYGAVKNAVHFDGNSALLSQNKYEVGGDIDFTLDFWARKDTTQGSAFGALVALEYGLDYDHFHFSSAKPELCIRVVENGEVVKYDVTENLPENGITAHYALVYTHEDSKVRLFIGGHCISIQTIPVNKRKYKVQLGLNSDVQIIHPQCYGIGSVDELRLSKCARWTEDFTPSGEAYTSDSDTLLLMHFN